MSTEHDSERCSLRDDRVEDETPPTQQANGTSSSSVSETISHAWCTGVVCQVKISGVIDSKIVRGDHDGGRPSVECLNEDASWPENVILPAQIVQYDHDFSLSSER